MSLNLQHDWAIEINNCFSDVGSYLISYSQWKQFEFSHTSIENIILCTYEMLEKKFFSLSSKS